MNDTMDSDKVAESNALVRAVISQFARPRGVLGPIVGWILANRSSNIRRGIWTIEQLKLSPRDRVLEIGCGPGIAVKACLERVQDGFVVGLDHSDVMIAQSARRNRRALKGKRLKLIAGTLADLPAGEPPFDRIFSINLIQFMADKRAFATDCVGRLAPNGVFATTFQPRGVKPTREAAVQRAGLIDDLLRTSGMSDVRTEFLELKPVPAICVLGRKG
jgi:SAM-dependent methyltransferase